MKTETESPGFRATLLGAAMLALALAFTGGCGDEEEPLDDDDDSGQDAGPDAGPNPPTDGGVPVDTEFAAVRFNANGSLDTSFGTNGVAHVDLGVGTANARESLYGMARDSSDRLVLFGSRKGAPDRVDTDRVVVRLTANGTLDNTFGTDGVTSLNISNLADNARHGIVQPDGKIVASGYTNQPTGVGTQSANRVVLQRLEANGALDNTFGSKGVVNSAPFQPADPTTTEWGMAEAYAVGYQSGKYVTTGYGRSTATKDLDLVAFRYTSTGQLDTTWGTNGRFELDVAGDADRGRNLVVLPDDRVLMVGSTTPSTQNIDAMVLMLTKDGARDTTFTADGYKTWTFDRADEAFFGAAVSPNGEQVAAAGFVAGNSMDDDALLLLLPIGGSTTESARLVPSSEVEHDRFWAVTFDAAGKAYAAGFVRQGNDSLMVVARFNPDGSRDTSFGANGIARHNVIEAGQVEEARAIVIQSDGKVVVAGTVEKQ